MQPAPGCGVFVSQMSPGEVFFLDVNRCESAKFSVLMTLMEVQGFLTFHKGSEVIRNFRVHISLFEEFKS